MDDVKSMVRIFPPDDKVEDREEFYSIRSPYYLIYGSDREDLRSAYDLSRDTTPSPPD